MSIAPARPEHATPVGDEGLSSALRVSVMRLARRIRLERSSEDLSFNQLSVMGTLLRSGELTLGELAAIERVKPPSITRTVNWLVDAGLVDPPTARDRRSPGHGRRSPTKRARCSTKTVAAAISGSPSDSTSSARPIASCCGSVAPLLDLLAGS